MLLAEYRVQSAGGHGHGQSPAAQDGRMETTAGRITGANGRSMGMAGDLRDDLQS